MPLSAAREIDHGIVLRHLEDDDDFEQCLRLQQATWGDDFNECVHPTLLRISQKVSGIAAGAFSADGKMLAFVYGLTGLKGQRKIHWSHMLAADQAARGLGLGKHLKVYQRDALLPLGVDAMYWTYDPLVARNANLNLNRLGALPDEFVRDMYGTDTGSDLHSGLGTDRFIVEWPLEDPGVIECLEEFDGERRARVDLADDLELRLLNSDAAGQPSAGCAAERLELGTTLFVEVPADIDLLKDTDMPQARLWQQGVRASLEVALAHGFKVTGLGYRAAQPETISSSTFSSGPSRLRYFYRLEAQS